jgi:hypothetical protein
MSRVTKPRAAGPKAILHSHATVQADIVRIVVYTKTSQSYTSADANLGRTTDLPRRWWLIGD